MAGLRAPFFGSREDFKSLLKAFDELGDFEYVQIHSSLNSELIIHNKGVNLLSSCLSESQPNKFSGYLIFYKNERLFLDRFNKSDGSGYKYTIKQSYNPNSIRIALGGDIGNNTIIASMFDSLGESEKAKEIFKKFKKVLIKMSKKVNQYRVLPDAYEKLENGWRLAQENTFQSKLDLKLEVKVNK